MTKKIYVDRKDSLAGVIEKVTATEETDIVLYIPRSTKLASSSNNFRHLKRELDAAGKDVEIESVDDGVLEAAKMMGFKSANPFFRKNHKQVSDIMHPGEKMADRHEYQIEREENVVEDPEPIKKKPRQHHYSPRKISNRHKVLGAIIATAFLVGGAFAIFVLPEAKIKVSMKSINSDIPVSYTTGSEVKSSELTNNFLKTPGIFVEKTKSISRTYPATGTQSLSTKATGTITISNAYSSAPQGLVVGTRFASPDGKIFRLTKSITVPGRKSATVPSTIDAAVQADVAGAEYNLPPSHFTIPGFKGTAKYAGFYGDSASAMDGGAVGMTKVASDSDIEKGKTEIHKALESELQGEMSGSIPNDIKILEGATRFIVTKEDIVKVADSDGNFKITSYGSLQSIGFKEADIRGKLEKDKVLKELAENDAKTGVDNSAKWMIIDSVITYGAPRADFVKKEMSLSLKLHSSLRRNLDEDAFKEFVMGKKGSELAAAQLPFPGIEKVTLNLWPFWVMSVPTNPSKVTIDVE